MTKLIDGRYLRTKYFKVFLLLPGKILYTLDSKILFNAFTLILYKLLSTGSVNHQTDIKNMILWIMAEKRYTTV